MTQENVILVDSNDNMIGSMEKYEAHEKGLLHRAFSVFLFNDQDELLLQQRALSKYHCGGLWTNSCCSHQRLGETNVEAAKRRLMEELGITAMDLQDTFSFVYKAQFDNGLTEHEFDYVLFGKFNGTPEFNEEEVAETKYLNRQEIQDAIQQAPQQFTPWFKLIYERAFDTYFSIYKNKL
ncbi:MULTISPECIES: isopentenyl-diphosphate Delta-isomerase [Sphingobacterium]|uniref:isopentenyl-diphosphate Delta-isomerase n=1 Tax=Sphingobacterium TaxID=28453 RepID=UPI00096865A1|nr:MULTISPECIES: isopentenyl-diphosphate Delta-isomerase [Sphingobacterium]OJZ13298.1 MAG: isopentenyl-diphosphate delta-isomerase [Sphingobacterium sp. 40-24]HAF36252.1 isopentenyl-diphosphate delta-isomerase [Sphingobacterium sp.]HAT94320.1 isopentenyl-diphosphate delta-isomerase [Sphingobacterium sp.]